MHRYMWAIWLALGILASGAPRAQATPITYKFVQYPSLQNGYFLSGTITTNGTLGTLAGTDVIAWTWTITNGVDSDTESGTSLGPQTLGLTATTTQLTVNGSSGQVVFQGPPNVYLEYAPSLANYDAAILGGTRAWLAQTQHDSLGGDPWIIATANGYLCASTPSLNGRTLNLHFDVETPAPAVWNLWLSYGTTVSRIWSIALPASPGFLVDVPINNFPALGSIGFLTTLVTSEGIVCSDWEVVDTGTPLTAQPARRVQQIIRDGFARAR